MLAPNLTLYAPYPAQLLRQPDWCGRALVLVHLLLAMGATLPLLGLPPVAGILLAAGVLALAHGRAVRQWARVLRLSWQRLMLHVAVLLGLLLWPQWSGQVMWLFPLALLPLALADAWQLRQHQPMIGDGGEHE